jgi:hypothetical protein
MRWFLCVAAVVALAACTPPPPTTTTTTSTTTTIVPPPPVIPAPVVASGPADPGNCGTPDMPEACPPMPRHPLPYYPPNK